MVVERSAVQGSRVEKERRIAGEMELIEGGSEQEEVMDEEVHAELARKKGNDKADFEEPRKPLAGKLPASSLADHPQKQTEQQIAADEALAFALQQEFELNRKGVTEIPQVKPLQTVSSSQAGASGLQAVSSSQAGTSGSSIQAPASTLALASSAALASATVGTASASQAIIPFAPTEKKKDMPPTPAPKTQLIRTTPESREEDPAAKRRKMQQTVAAKTGHYERRKEREEGKKRHAEKDKRLKLKRVNVVEGRIESHWNEVRLIQSAISRSSYIPFTPEESEACQTQAMIDTCRVTIKEMVDSKRYTDDECELIRKLVNAKKPQFNTDASAKFHKIVEELTSRTEEELVVRRGNHPDAREIEEFITSDLLEMWLICKERFIKAYYFWQVVPYQDECSRLDALNNFLCYYNEELRRKIFTQVEEADRKPIIINVPAITDFPMPLLPNSSVPNRRIIDEEVDEALRLESSFRPNQYNVKTMEEKVLSAYYLEEEKDEEQKKPAEDL